MDDGQDIKPEVKEIMSIKELYALMEDTQGRFSFEIITGTYAECTWRDYVKKNGDRVRYPKTGIYKDLPTDKRPFQLKEVQKTGVIIGE